MKSLSLIATLFYGCQAVVNGYGRLKNPFISRGLSIDYSLDYQNMYGIRGLVPRGAVLEKIRTKRIISVLNSKTRNIDKYEYLHNIKDISESLYFSLLFEYTEELLPIVYTPTVGEACLKWSTMFNEQIKGLYISLDDRGSISQCLENWPNKNIKVIVMTDGERILGLGDLGSNGMGIPIGKLALYTVCAGIKPEECLPIQIDVGCNNIDILKDPYYIGTRRSRPPANSLIYMRLVEEIIRESQKKYGKNVLIQFEDFGNRNAFKLLEKWQKNATCFNDDIQGTAAVVLGGLLASERFDNRKIEGHTFLFYGAGEAGIGIANLISRYIQRKLQYTPEEASCNIWLFDSKGLVENTRPNLPKYKRAYAHKCHTHNTLEGAIECIKPTILIGVSGQGGAFTQQVIQKFVECAEFSPIIMALSNPTDRAECTAESAYLWSNNKAAFISGSPFKPVFCTDGLSRTPGQGNNAYIFPGVGLGAISCGATILEDDDFIEAAKELARQVTDDNLIYGTYYPPISRIREVSANIAVKICQNQWIKGTAAIFPPDWVQEDYHIFRWIVSKMYDPE
tara:strand:+ start:41 stop:1738 length:1698 start_codon:yes stop_codon:yes gene_type:complete